MKKTVPKRLAAMFFVVVISIGFTLSAYGANTEPPLLKGNLTWNIRNIHYYVDTSANQYATEIANAANNWVNTGYGWNDLYPLTRTYTITYSAIDISGYSSATDGLNAYTTFWKRTNGTSGNAYQVSYNENWLYNEVKLNTKNLAGKTSQKRQGVIAHEMGHCFGLNENNSNPNSIMCQESAGRAVYTVQRVDQNAFNRKHPPKGQYK